MCHSVSLAYKKERKKEKSSIWVLEFWWIGIYNDKLGGGGEHQKTVSLEHSNFHMNMRKIFIFRVMEHWNRLPGEAVEFSSLEIFKILLDTFLHNLF